MAFLFGSNSGGPKSPPSAPAFTGLRAQSSALGLPIPVIFGVTRISGNLLDWINFRAIPHTSTATQGGKGGADLPSQTTYTYSVSFLLALGEGPFWTKPIRQCWSGKEKISFGSFEIFRGTWPQTPWAYLTSNYPSHALPYPGIAMVGGQDFDLGSADTLPPLSFLVVALNPYTGTYETVTDAPVTLPKAVATSETIIVSSSPTDYTLEYTAMPPGGGAYVQNEGVWRVSTNELLTKVSGDPANPWEYSVNEATGFYKIRIPADTSDTVTIAYYYAASGNYFYVYLGADGEVKNPPPSYVPDPRLWVGWTQQGTPNPNDPLWDAFKEDLGVDYAGGGALTKVADNPAKGQYAVVTVGDRDGVYKFNKFDGGASLLISYSYYKLVGADPKDILTEILTNTHWGMGLNPLNLADLSDFSDYCLANNRLLSPAYIDQKPGVEVLRQMMLACHAEIIESGGQVKVAPYGDEAATGNGVTWTPDLTPQYDLTDDDYLAGDGDPVKVIRKSQADCYNCVKVEYLNKDNEWNPEIAEAKDLADIEANGLREMETKQCHEVTDKQTATDLAHLLLQNSLHVKTQFEFTVSGWKYCRLEPMDLVTLSTTRGSLSLDRKLVRLVTVEETEDDHLQMLAEEVITGTAAAAVYPPVISSQTPIYIHSALPEPVNPPILIWPNARLRHQQVEIWVGVSGGENWGGCELWIAGPAGTIYRYKHTFRDPCRMGQLTAALPKYRHDTPDETNTLKIDLGMSRGEMVSGTEEDADALRTLIQICGERIEQFGAPDISPTPIYYGQMLSYAAATYQGNYEYWLNYLVRQPFDGWLAATTATRVLLLDNSIYKFKLPVGAMKDPGNPNGAGKRYFLKFLSYNLAGTKRQSLDEVAPYEILIPQDWPRWLIPIGIEPGEEDVPIDMSLYG
jgi:hypothetical protein